jgi:hypothetical protein
MPLFAATTFPHRYVFTFILTLCERQEENIVTKSGFSSPTAVERLLLTP